MSAAEEAARALAERAHGSVKPGGLIGPLTSYRIGGPAAVLFEPSSEQDLDALAAVVEQTGLPVLVVGRGSNMLVSDRGFPGIAVRLGAGFRWATVEDARIHAGAAMPLPTLAARAMHERLAGFEFASAIPASLGGAVAMNAGAHGREISDVFERARVYVLGEGRARTVQASDAGFAYRTSRLPAGSIVMEATVSLTPGEPEAIAEAMREVKEWRRATQPLNLPNGGSVFKNPPGDHAARLVEQVCGKGTAVGRARVSEVHANFIVTEAGATADEVYTLIRQVQRAVAEQAGVALETELKLIGEFQEVGR